MKSERTAKARSEGNRAKVKENIKRLAIRADDPLLIGYFIANEPLHENLPAKIPTLDAAWACKRALVDMLAKQYGTLEAFHQVWGIQDGATLEDLCDRRPKSKDGIQRASWPQRKLRKIACV